MNDTSSSNSVSSTQKTTAASGSVSNTAKEAYKKSIEIIVSYPELIPHEEALFTTPYDVSGWYHYFMTIDSLIDSLQTHNEKYREKKKQKDFVIASSSTNNSMNAQNNKIQYDRIPKAIHSLSLARVMVAERALTLLPGELSSTSVL